MPQSGRYNSMRRFFLITFLALTASTSSTFGDDATDIDTVLDNLEWRNIGPAIMGGRINDFAAVESNPHVVFVATASAGIWKTTNNGITWEPLFDDQSVSSVGDIAVAPVPSASSRSKITMSLIPRFARWYAIDVPMMPPPMMATSTLFAIGAQSMIAW